MGSLTRLAGIYFDTDHGLVDSSRLTGQAEALSPISCVLACDHLPKAKAQAPEAAAELEGFSPPTRPTRGIGGRRCALRRCNPHTADEEHSELPVKGVLAEAVLLALQQSIGLRLMHGIGCWWSHAYLCMLPYLLFVICAFGTFRRAHCRATV